MSGRIELTETEREALYVNLSPPWEGYEGLFTAVEAILTARLERERDAARQATAVAAVLAFRGLHPVHGNTAGCGGGIGGQAITSECAIECPNPKHDDARSAWDRIEYLAYNGCDRDEGDSESI